MDVIGPLIVGWVLGQVTYVVGVLVIDCVKEWRRERLKRRYRQ